MSVETPLSRAVIVELCGLPGAGKSSLASALGNVQDGLPLARPTRGIAPDVKATRRLARKLGLVAVETIRRPVLEAEIARRIGRSGQPGRMEAVSRWVQWASTQSLMGSARRSPQVHLFDEGVVQALWSLGLRGDPAGTLGTLGGSVSRWSFPDVVVVLDPPVELLARRLRDRRSAHSRLQRLSDDAELHAELVRGRALLERLITWWRSAAPAEASVIRIAGAHHDPAVVMHAIDAAVHRIGAKPHILAVGGREGGSATGP